MDLRASADSTPKYGTMLARGVHDILGYSDTVDSVGNRQSRWNGQARIVAAKRLKDRQMGHRVKAGAQSAGFGLRFDECQILTYRSK
jgi:hypothetical protein